MGKLIDFRKTKLICFAVALCFLAIHIALLAVFAFNGVKPMAYVNIFSILAYLVCLLLIYKGRTWLFVAIAFTEVLIHMSLAVWFVGWESGFQISLIAITLMIFFGVYIGKVLHLDYFPSMPLSIICMVTYIALFVISHVHQPQYPLPDKVSFWMQLWWSLAVFLLTIFSLQSFVWLAFHSEDLLFDQATTDKLTGLYNRYYITEALKKLEVDGSIERSWAAMVDIDDFKNINDSHGHLFGDYVLKTLADIMNSCNVDAEIGRWGGEEFLITGYVDDDINIHTARLENLRRTVENYDFCYEGVSVKLTVTIGVAVYRKGQTVDQWIDAADKKLYEGKSSGKNKLVI